MPAHYEQLLEQAMQRAVNGKGGLAASIAETCLTPNAGLTESELSLTFDIVRILVETVEVEIRRHLAEYLAEREDVPTDLLEYLANDEISVAYPMLVHNQILQDDELINIVANRTKKHRLAISIRPSVSENVSEALVDTGDTDVIESLLYNTGAAIRQETLESIVKTARNTSSFHLPLVHRQDLSVNQARRLYAWVGHTLREYIQAHFDVETEMIDGATVSAVADALRESENAAAIDHKAALRDALRYKNRHDIEVRFTACVSLDPAAATKILYGRSVQALAIACKASGLSVATFSALISHTRSEKTGRGTGRRDNSVRAISFFDQIDITMSQKTLKKWRNSPSSIWRKDKI